MGSPPLRQPVASVPKGGKGWGRVCVCTLPGTGTTWFQYFFLLEVTPTEETSVLGAPGGIRVGEGVVTPSPWYTLECFDSSGTNDRGAPGA